MPADYNSRLIRVRSQDVEDSSLVARLSLEQARKAYFIATGGMPAPTMSLSEIRRVAVGALGTRRLLDVLED